VLPTVLALIGWGIVERVSSRGAALGRWLSGIGALRVPRGAHPLGTKDHSTLAGKWADYSCVVRS
jgi:hypothetical protein